MGSSAILRPNPHRTRDVTRNATRANGTMLMLMGVSTLYTSNIKGKMFQFACVSRPVWIGPHGDDQKCKRPPHLRREIPSGGGRTCSSYGKGGCERG